MSDRLPVQVERDVPATMRDGTVLMADVYRPAAAGPFPVLLMRCPYDRRVAQTIVYAHPAWYAAHGYVVVSQDTRGRWGSAGEFRPFAHESEDGYDSVEWAAGLPGADGQVGMYGFSYVGYLQLLAARAQPPHLRTIVPAFTAAGLYHTWMYPGGAFALSFNVSWAVMLAYNQACRDGDQALAGELGAALGGVNGWYWYRPLAQLPPLAGRSPYFDDWLAHPADDAFWRDGSMTGHYDDITVPALHLTGWYEAFRDGNLQNFRALTAAGRAPQRIVVGPWYHIPWHRRTGGLDFGPEATNQVDALQLRWFDHWLKGRDTGLLGEPPVRYFLMGANRWETAGAWPPPGHAPTALYLHSSGRANSAGGDGTLAPELPGDEPPDLYVYDPENPVPSLGGTSCCTEDVAAMGPYDQSKLEGRNDILVYTGPPLAEAVDVAGEVTAVIWVASSAVDTDFTAKLVDVYPDGRAINLCDGILRARYRNSFTTPEWMEPGQVYPLRIRLGATAVRLAPGHRLRVEVSSSNFPTYDRNPNTGRVPALAGPGESVPATQTVYHDQAHPSHVIIPVRSVPI